LEINLNKLMEENEKIGAQTREYRKTCANLESELEKSKELNRNLVKSREDLKIDLDELKEQFNRSLGDKSTKLDLNDEKINSLQLELTKCNSKLDEACLQLNEAKKNYTSQLKQVSRKFYFILLAKMLCGDVENCKIFLIVY
jgi:chromosome segregation ATPase